MAKDRTLSGLDWLPSFVWFDCNVQQTWFAKLPMRHWEQGYEAVGGAARAAAGPMEGFQVRQDHLLTVTLRLWEQQWPSLVNLVRWGQTNGDPLTSSSITFRYDQTDAATAHKVTLWSPAMGERFAPRRSSEFPHVLEADLTLRHDSTAPFAVDYYKV